LPSPATLSDRLAARLFRLVSWLVARAPLPAAYWLAGALGDLYYWLNPGHSRHAVANMAIVLAQHPALPAVRRLARASFRYYAMYMLDLLRLPAVPPSVAGRHVLTEGWEHLEAALAGGRGAVLLGTHFGSWDRAAPLFAARGLRVHVVADTVGGPALDAAIRRLREATGVNVIPAEGGATLRALYAALRRNEIVALIMDRPQRERGTPVTFFGRQTWLPSGPAMLARRTGAPLLHAYLLRRPDLVTYQGVIEPVPLPAPTGDRAADEQAIMQVAVARIEWVIQRHPEQWYMFRPMWPEERP
jgi:KDO2-lipid IV(A) lauroyltransferase